MDKLTLFIVIGVFAVVLFDGYTKYAEQKRKDDLKAQQIANQTILQLEKEKANQLAQQNQSGFLGNLLGSIPIIGGLF